MSRHNPYRLATKICRKKLYKSNKDWVISGATALIFVGMLQAVNVTNVHASNDVSTNVSQSSASDNTTNDSASVHPSGTSNANSSSASDSSSHSDVTASSSNVHSSSATDKKSGASTSNISSADVNEKSNANTNAVNGINSVSSASSSASNNSSANSNSVISNVTDSVSSNSNSSSNDSTSDNSNSNGNSSNVNSNQLDLTPSSNYSDSNDANLASMLRDLSDPEVPVYNQNGIKKYSNGNVEIDSSRVRSYFGLNGIATNDGVGDSTTKLTDDEQYKAVNVYFNSALDLSRPFTFDTNLQWSEDGSNYGDGIGMYFSPTSNGLNAIGKMGGSLGIIGLKNVYGFKLDMVVNPDDTNAPGNTHND